MKATIALLLVWLVTLLVEVPAGVWIVAQRSGLTAIVAPLAVEAIFILLIVVFVVYCRRAKRWSYAGALGAGVAHALLSAAIYLRPGGPPLVLGVWLTLAPALVAASAAASLLEPGRWGAPRPGAS